MRERQIAAARGVAVGVLASVAVLGSARPSAALPDLTPDVPGYTVQFDASVGSGDVAEGCAQTTSGVDLLRFTVRARNVGPDDLALGDPHCPEPCSDHPGAICGNPDFECSPAEGHNHPHYVGFLKFELLDGSGTQVLLGRKSSFCLRDSQCANPKFTCLNQGITAGCADVYSASLGCQYLDISAVPSGDYALRVTVDAENKIAEVSEDNNQVTLPVRIPPRSGSGGTTTSSIPGTTSTSIATTTTVPTASTSTTLPGGSTTSTLPGQTTSTTVAESTTTTLTAESTSTTAPESSSTTLPGGSSTTLPPTTTSTPGASTTTTTLLPVVCTSDTECPTVRASVATGGGEADRRSLRPAISGDGRFVVFESLADNLIAGDTNRQADIFMRDRTAGTTARLSVAADGTQANGSSETASISADGRLVAFASNASNLVPGDTNRAEDVFVRDVVAGTIARVSVASDGTQGDDESLDPVISADGRIVAFTSNATTLVPNDTSGIDVFVHELATGKTTRVSLASDGTEADDDCVNPAISSDGRFVAFESRATNLVSGDTNGATDIFLHDVAAGTTVRVSVAGDGTEADGDSFNAALSGDGRFVAFESRATNLVPNDTNGASDVFVHDMLTGTTVRVSVDSGGAEADRGSFFPDLSPDGRFVAFTSSADNLVPGDTNGARDVFVRDLVAATTVRASMAFNGAQPDKDSFGRALSADGALVTFESDATNLVAGDTNGATDVFVHNSNIDLSAECRSDADCDDKNGCTVDHCAAARCSHAERPGFDGVVCALRAAFQSPLCQPGGIRRGLERVVVRTMKRVVSRLEHAHRTGKAKRFARVVVRVERVIGRLEHRLDRAAHRGRITATCRAALAERLSTLQARIGGLRL